MFRRTLLLFAGFVTLVLAVTVGYALLGLAGPRTAIEQADEALAAGRLTEAVRLLDMAERTLTPSERAELLAEILGRRFRVHRRLDNVTMARRDLEALLDLAPADAAELQVDHAALLLAAGEAQRALAACEQHLARHADVRAGRAREVAGAAAQALYERDLAELQAAVGNTLGGDVRESAVAELIVAVHRHAGDPRGAAALARFEELARRYAPAEPAWQRWRQQIASIRAGVEAATRHFTASLESDHPEPQAAFRGLSRILDAAGRDDDLVALAEIYLRRFTGPHAIDAAIRLAEIHFAAGRFALAADAASRYLPAGTAQARAEAGQLPPGCTRLMLVQARALAALGDGRRLQALGNDVHLAHTTGKVRMLPDYFLIRGYWFATVRQFADAVRSLQQFRATPEVRAPLPRDHAGEDRYALAAELELQALAELGGRQAETDALFADWISVRPTDAAAWRQRGRHHLRTDRPEFAAADAERLLDLDAHDEDALRLLVDATAAVAEQSGAGPAALLARCVTRQDTDPRELRHPALFLAVGEAALAAGQPRIAMRCGEIAARSYSWSRWPRRLQVEGAVAAGDPERALRAAQTFRELHPESDDALRALRRAAAAAGQTNPQLLFDVALHGLPDPELARSLLDAAVADRSTGLLAALAARVQERFAAHPDVLVRAGLALLAAGDGTAGRQLLRRLSQECRSDRRAARAAAIQYLMAEAAADPGSADLPRAVQAVAAHVGTEADTILDIAEELERAGRPELGLQLLAPLLEPAESTLRSGRLFHVAGRLALATGADAQAEAHFVAALGFEDAPAAARALSLLWLRQEKEADARSAIWFTQADDAAGACLLLALGRPEPAHEWARREVARAPLHVVATAVLALTAGNPAEPLPYAFAAIARDQRPALVELLALLTTPGFQVHARQAARSLAEAAPENPVAGFLLARALAGTGQREAAVAELTRLIQKDPGFLPAYDEILELSEGGLRADISAIRDPLSATVAGAPALATPRMLTAVGHTLALQIGAAHRNPDLTFEILSRLWLQFPAESRTDLSHVIALNARGRTQDALSLLELIEPRLPASERSLFLELYFTVGRRLAEAGDSAHRQRLDAYARKVLREEGTFGPAVHHLVDRLEAQHGPLAAAAAPAGDEARTLLHRHLEFTAEGKDRNIPTIMRSLGRIEELDGIAAALRRTDTLLRADPTLLAVWRHRAALLERQGDFVAALASLRWIHDYVPDQAMLVDLARVAGLHGQLAPGDRALLDAELTAATRADPQARFALALLALRQGELEQADALLRDCPPRADGGHLFFLAIANVARGEGVGAAQAAFRELSDRHPTSPYAVHAGHLAAQLARLDPPASPR